MSDVKRCSKCGEDKPVSEFYKNRQTKDGLQPECKSCKNKYQDAKRKANPEKFNAYHRKWYKANSEKIREQHNKSAMCKVLKKHHEDVKDDPEHLSTDFIRRIIEGAEI